MIPVAETTATGLLVVDDFLPHPESYRQWALQQTFHNIPIGAVTFYGICPLALDDLVPRLIQQTWPTLTPTTTMFRRSPLGQQEPSFIHQDRDMGEWTAILYLTLDPPATDGTEFWRDKETGAITSTAEGEALREEWRTWRGLERWEVWRVVEAKFNRLLLFASPLFHSRRIVENYGFGNNARLVQVVFGTGEGPWLLPPA